MQYRSDDVEKLLQFLYLAPLALLELQRDGEIVMMNAFAAQYLMPISGGRMTNFFDVLRPHAPEIVDTIAAFRPSSGSVLNNRRISIAAPGREGAPLYYSLTVEKLEDNCLMVALTDVTEAVEQDARIKQAIEQEAVQRGKAELAASVLHDIGNAITGIGTTVARLLGGEAWYEETALRRLEDYLRDNLTGLEDVLGAGKADALLTYLGEIRNALHDRAAELEKDYARLAQITTHISELLSLQRTYADESQTYSSSMQCDLVQVLEDAISMQAAGLEKRSVVVQRRYPQKAVRIFGDRTKLVRVFVNLLRNACESFDRNARQTARRDQAENTIEIGVSILTGPRAQVVISDNGSGFEPERSDQLFDSASSSKSSGGGIGLAVCRRIVAAHNGTIELTSEGPGQGARAVVELPFKATETTDHIDHNHQEA